MSKSYLIKGARKISLSKISRHLLQSPCAFVEYYCIFSNNNNNKRKAIIGFLLSAIVFFSQFKV